MIELVGFKKYSERLNPRWLGYMYAMGFTDPDEFMEHEHEQWPGGCMCGFMLWMAPRKREFITHIQSDLPHALQMLIGQRAPHVWNDTEWDHFLEAATEARAK